MEVSIPVWQSSSGKRKRREESFSSDRSSSPSILVVTHSDAVMKSVRTVGPGFTPPRDYWHPSLLSASPEPVKKTKGKKRGRGRPRKSGDSPDKAIEIDSAAEERDNYAQPAETSYPSRQGNNYVHPDVRAEEIIAPPATDQYARKKLPTAAQIVHGSNLKGIQPRHKIPTKPFGRSPWKNRQRSELRKQKTAGSTSYFSSLTGKNGASSTFGSLSAALPGESSANDDDDGDEDMYYQTGRFSSRTLNNSSSTRALRSTRKSNGARAQRPFPTTNGHGVVRGQSPEAGFIPSASQPPRPAKKAKTDSALPQSTGQYKKGINPKITQKMPLTQAGFSKRESLWLSKGGYSSIKHLTREGLACTVEDFGTFKSWLANYSLETHTGRDPQNERQAIRDTVKALAEEVRIRSAIVWEAAGMMEEGSDAYAEESNVLGQNGTGTELEDFFAPYSDAEDRRENGQSSRAHETLLEDDASQVILRQKQSRMSNGHSTNHQGHNEEGTMSSGSSDIEYLGMRS